MPEKPMVLFLCTGNSCRSQIAEALFRKQAGDRFEVVSAGTDPKPEIHPLAIQVLAEVGVEPTGQYPKRLGLYLGRAPIRHLVIVCDGADKQCPSTYPGVLTRTFWPLEDPAAAEGTPEERLAKFRQTRDDIDGRIRSWLAERVPA